MTERDVILAALRAALPELRSQWPIRSLALFGSMARGEAAADSDVDVLVEFDRPIGYAAFLELEERLAALVGRRIDLVSAASVKPFAGQAIKRDLLPL